MLHSLHDSLQPRIISYYKKHGFQKDEILSDIVAGLIVAIVALPLAMAIAIASNLPPERGVFTAIVAGFLISAHGGSRYQIGGPTAAFIVTVSMVAMKHGYEGLVLATIMAGGILIIMALVRAGELIKFIPYPVIVGFTSGIALLIAFSQIRDFFGLTIATIPPDFIHKLTSYLQHLHTANLYAVLVAATSLALLIGINRTVPKIPAPIVVVILSALATWGLNLPIETIESRFGAIPSMLPDPTWPVISFEKLRLLLPDAITIATLAAIESLLSAVVADGMTGTKHKSNAELLGQGIANVASGIFGGLPATGAIARTAINIKSGAKSPLAGIMHALWLFAFMALLAPAIVKIPLAALAAILIMVAWNMSEIKHFKEIMSAPKSDQAVLIVTFLLTVLVDLNFAIQAGIALASLLFINQMMKSTHIKAVRCEDDDPDSIQNKSIPHGVEVYEIQGPLFFGVAEKLLDALTLIEKPARVFILRMRYVPLVDAAGIHALEILHDRLQNTKTQLILSGVNPHVYQLLHSAHLDTKIGENHIVDHIDKALVLSKELLEAS